MMPIIITFICKASPSDITPRLASPPAADTERFIILRPTFTSRLFDLNAAVAQLLPKA